GGPWGIALGGSFVYWSNLDDGTIARTHVDGGAVEIVGVDLGAPAGLSLIGGSLYWADPIADTVNALPLGGGRARVLATGQEVTSPLLADERQLYWTDANRQAVMSVGLQRGKPQRLAAGQIDPVGLAVQGGWVWFATRGDGDLKRARVPGGAVDTVLADRPPAMHVAVAGGEMVWADDTGTLYAYAP
ncbi:MAG TPA: hypothetical protein VL172_22800, partial [Kofleriaceae bacterium]|nr:hypothetical protein [Kofleriaceae bacterium]